MTGQRAKDQLLTLWIAPIINYLLKTMTQKINRADLPRLSKELAKAKADLYKENPDLNILSIEVDEEGVTMNPSTAFDLLYARNPVLWENVLDEFIEIAQEKFLEYHKIDPDSDHDHYLENGCEFTEDSIMVLR